MERIKHYNETVDDLAKTVQRLKISEKDMGAETLNKTSEQFSEIDRLVGMARKSLFNVKVEYGTYLTKGELQ